MSIKTRSKYSQDLGWLHSILDQKGFIKDLSPLYDSIEKCKKAPYGKDFLWGHEMYKLNFGPIQSLKKIRPKGYKNLQLLLSVKCIGLCSDEPQHDNVTELRFDLNVSGEDKNRQKVITAWHLDCHIINEEDGDPEHCHPLYHFQQGGDTILDVYESDEYNFGTALFLESPRLTYPPMDIVLGINFVLSQFYGNHWKEVLKEPKYNSLIRESQQRLWKPYFSKIQSYFDSPHMHEPAKLLMPDLFN
ncbi:MAG: hypothetical protein ABJH08_13120 [Balneola sp.]